MANNKKETQGTYLALGMCFGVTFGIIFDNLALGISFGLLIGLLIDNSISKKNNTDSKE